MEDVCYQFFVHIEETLLPQAAINHLLIFILIRTISVFQLIRIKNPSPKRQPVIMKPQLQYSHPALNIYHTKNKYKNNQIKSFVSFRSIVAGLRSGLRSSSTSSPSWIFKFVVSPSWDSCFVSNKSAHQSRRLWTKIGRPRLLWRRRPEEAWLKMTPTDRFRVRRRFLEPRYRNIKSWNFKLGQLPLKFTFYRNSSFHRSNSLVHCNSNFHDSRAGHS